MIIIISSPSLSFFIILTFCSIYACHILTLSHYYFNYLFYCLILLSFILFDYLCTSHILSYCSTFHFLPIGHSTPLTSWHYPLLSFLQSSKYSLHSYWLIA